MTGNILKSVTITSLLILATASTVFAQRVERGRMTPNKSVYVDITGARNETLQLAASSGDRVECLVFKDKIHIWGLEGRKGNRNRFSISMDQTDLPTGSVNFLRGDTSKRIFLGTEANNDVQFWIASSQNSCRVNFSNEGNVLKGNFKCQGFENATDLTLPWVATVNANGTFECEVKDLRPLGI